MAAAARAAAKETWEWDLVFGSVGIYNPYCYMFYVATGSSQKRDTSASSVLVMFAVALALRGLAWLRGHGSAVTTLVLVGGGDDATSAWSMQRRNSKFLLAYAYLLLRR